MFAAGPTINFITSNLGSSPCLTELQECTHRDETRVHLVHACLVSVYIHSCSSVRQGPDPRFKVMKLIVGPAATTF